MTHPDPLDFITIVRRCTYPLCHPGTKRYVTWKALPCPMEVDVQYMDRPVRGKVVMLHNPPESPEDVVFKPYGGGEGVLQWDQYLGCWGVAWLGALSVAWIGDDDGHSPNP